MEQDCEGANKKRTAEKKMKNIQIEYSPGMGNDAIVGSDLI